MIDMIYWLENQGVIICHCFLLDNVVSIDPLMAVCPKGPWTLQVLQPKRAILSTFCSRRSISLWPWVSAVQGPGLDKFSALPPNISQWTVLFKCFSQAMLRCSFLGDSSIFATSSPLGVSVAAYGFFFAFMLSWTLRLSRSIKLSISRFECTANEDPTTPMTSPGRKEIGAQLQRIYSTPNKSMAAVTKNQVPLSDLNSMASASSWSSWMVLQKIFSQQPIHRSPGHGKRSPNFSSESRATFLPISAAFPSDFRLLALAESHGKPWKAPKSTSFSHHFPHEKLAIWGGTFPFSNLYPHSNG